MVDEKNAGKPEKKDRAVRKGRDNLGRFKPGHSGNPAGRSKNSLYAAIEAMTEEQSDVIAQKLADMIQGGDRGILEILLKHALPRGRKVHIPSLSEQPIQAILAAIEGGSISAEEGAALATVAKITRMESEIAEIREILQRLR